MSPLSRTILGSLLALMAAGSLGCGNASANMAQAGIHMGVPPVPARYEHAPSYTRLNSYYEVQVGLDCPEKRVVVHWERSTVLDFSNPELYAAQEISVSFWPTSAELVGDNLLLVAGKDRDGDTRVERWELGTPLIATVAGVQKLLPRPPVDMTTVYEESVVGRDMIKFILKLQSKPGCALVQFYDSGDLYELDYSQEPFNLTLVLTQTSQPALGNAYTHCWRGEHMGLGDVYIYTAPESYGEIPGLLVLDQDKDGVIDNSVPMDDWQLFSDLGLFDTAQYVSSRGLPVE